MRAYSHKMTVTQTLYSYIICVEHDLSVLDYLSDFVCCLYGYSHADVIRIRIHQCLQSPWCLRCRNHAFQRP